MFQIISLKNLAPSQNNYRKSYDPDKLAELTSSVKDKGILEPILVRPLGKKGKYEVVAGARRYMAAQGAGLTEVPAIVKELTDEEALEIQIVENTQREDPNPMEEAWGFKRLLDMGKHTTETLSLKLDRSVAYVLGRLKMADLDKTVQDAIASGTIGPGHALLFTRLRNAEDQKKFLKEILDDDMSVRQAKEYVCRFYSLSLSEAPFDTANCTSCPYRSRNQAVLFADLDKKKDECTDKSCFYTKSKQHYTSLLKQKQGEGFKVYTDQKKVAALIGDGAKTSKRIVPTGTSGYFYRTEQPKRYKSECVNCTDHHAYYLYEEKEFRGKVLQFGEICLNKTCLDAMQSGGKKQERSSASGSETASESRANPHTLRTKARECRDRFLLKTLAPRVEASETLRKRLIICHILNLFPDHLGAGYASEFFKKHNPGFKGPYHNTPGFYNGIAGIHNLSLDEAIDDLVSLTFHKTNPDVMLRMTPEAGIDIARDFVMDEEYLNGKTKDELLELLKEVVLNRETKYGVPLSATNKKNTITAAILAQDLVGKVPEIIAEVCRLEDKGGLDEDPTVCDECGEEGEDCTCEGGPGLSGPEEEANPAEGETEPEPENDPTMPKATKVKIKRGKK